MQSAVGVLSCSFSPAENGPDYFALLSVCIECVGPTFSSDGIRIVAECRMASSLEYPSVPAALVLPQDPSSVLASPNMPPALLYLLLPYRHILH